MRRPNLFFFLKKEHKYLHGNLFHWATNSHPFSYRIYPLSIYVYVYTYIQSFYIWTYIGIYYIYRCVCIYTCKSSILFFIFILFIFKFLIYFLVALGLCCYAQAFSGCWERGLFVAVHGLLIAVASLVAEHGL